MEQYTGEEQTCRGLILLNTNNFQTDLFDS